MDIVYVSLMGYKLRLCLGLARLRPVPGQGWQPTLMRVSMAHALRSRLVGLLAQAARSCHL